MVDIIFNGAFSGSGDDQVRHVVEGTSADEFICDELDNPAEYQAFIKRGSNVINDCSESLQQNDKVVVTATRVKAGNQG